MPRKKTKKKTKSRAAWREPFFEDVIERCDRLGQLDWEPEKIWQIILKQSILPTDKTYPAKVQRYYKKASAFSLIGKQRLLYHLKRTWPGYKPKKKKIYGKPKKEKKKDPDDNSCKACAGTRRNTKKRLCICVRDERRHNYGSRVDMIRELRVQGITRRKGNHHKIENIPDGLLQEMVEKARQEAEGLAVPSPREDLSSSAQVLLPPPPPPPPPETTTVLPPPPPPPNSLILEEEALPPPPPPPLEEAVEPVRVGKVYSDDAEEKENLDEPHRCRCVLAVRLHEIPNRNLEKGVVTETLHRYVVSETQFGANVRDAAHLHGSWWDLLVDYSVHLTRVYEVLLSHEWVVDGLAKPAAQFGVRTADTG
jgi:hypothetical protein